MYSRVVLAVAALTAVAGAQPQQEMRMRANIVGGGGPDRGSCRVEVLVDATAQLGIGDPFPLHHESHDVFRVRLS